MSDIAYHNLLRSIASLTDTPVFTTNVTNLYDFFLSKAPNKQQYVCRTCRSFVERVGGLVTIDPTTGLLSPALWDLNAVPDEFKEAVGSMVTYLTLPATRITGVYSYDPNPTDTTDHVGVICNTTHDGTVWMHMTTLVATKRRWDVPEVKKQVQMMRDCLKENKLDVCQKAVDLLKSGTLIRPEKVIAPAEWLLDLKKRTAAIKGPKADNLIWLAVAEAGVGFAHSARSGALSTLLEAIRKHIPIEVTVASWAKTMDPMKYQRMQAPPSDGNILVAEKLIRDLGYEKSLARRFARLEEVPCLWKPTTEGPEPKDIFDHLKKANQTPDKTTVHGVTPITWEKFSKTVLPSALSMKVLMPVRGPFVAFTTAVHADVPSLFQWDGFLSHYFYDKGSSSRQWNLTANTWQEVTGLAAHTGEEVPHMNKGRVALLAGAWDTLGREAGLALFPETLKNQLHPVRATIEAFSKKGRLEGCGEPHAVGIGLVGTGVTIRVTSPTLVQTFIIDRWD